MLWRREMYMSLPRIETRFLDPPTCSLVAIRIHHNKSDVTETGYEGVFCIVIEYVNIIIVRTLLFNMSTDISDQLSLWVHLNCKPQSVLRRHDHSCREKKSVPRLSAILAKQLQLRASNLD
jgi:hypothetical protein